MFFRSDLDYPSEDPGLLMSFINHLLGVWISSSLLRIEGEIMKRVESRRAGRQRADICSWQTLTNSFSFRRENLMIEMLLYDKADV